MSLPGKNEAYELMTELFSRRVPTVTFGRVSKEIQQIQKQQQAKKPEKKKISINEYESAEDWVLTMIMVALMHANPGMSPDEVIKEGMEWARKLGTPNKQFLWRKQATRIKRHGIRAEASKIRREMFKLL